MSVKTKSIGKQYKRSAFEIKSMSLGSRTISGYAAIFGVKDAASDILVKGCFAKSIAERGPESQANNKIIFLWMHNMSEPIGRVTKLIEDDKGLYFEAVIDDIPLGDRAIKQMESGTINQFSIGYTYVWDKVEYDDKMDAYIVKEVVLYELSAVSIGCNGATEYMGLKSDEDVTNNLVLVRTEIDECLAGMSVAKKSRMQELFSKVWALARMDLENDCKKTIARPIDSKEATPTKKNLLSIKFK